MAEIDRLTAQLQQLQTERLALKDEIIQWAQRYDKMLRQRYERVEKVKVALQDIIKAEGLFTHRVRPGHLGGSISVREVAKDALAELEAE